MVVRAEDSRWEVAPAAVQRLTQAGAKLVGERVTHDASGSDMADDLALPWVEGVLAEGVA